MKIVINRLLRKEDPDALSRIKDGKGKIIETRPWGRFEQFNLNQPCTVKIIHLNPHSELSLQFHRARTEFWKIIDGEGVVYIGGENRSAKRDDEFLIPRLMTHRASTGKLPLRILEIAYGHFDEQDIVRLEDKYDRISPRK